MVSSFELDCGLLNANPLALTILWFSEFLNTWRVCSCVALCHSVLLYYWFTILLFPVLQYYSIVACRMSTFAPAAAATAAPEVAAIDNHLKRKSSDIGWEWVWLCDPNDKNRVKCMIFGQESSAKFIAWSNILIMLAHMWWSAKK